MLIEVTQGDIDRGQVGECGNCPVALAIRRSLDRTVRPEVWPGRVYIENGKELKCITLPNEAEEFIIDFDNENPVSPFTFELNYP